MIKYSLRCAACEYKFPGWFRNSDAYDEQLAANAISCPSCGDNGVGKALTTPYVKRSRSTQSTSGGDGSSAASVASLRQASEAARIREMMRRLRCHVESRCEDVGSRFAEEAREMHEGRSKKRDIYGEADPGEVTELREEGIPVGVIPWDTEKDS